jgi:TPR repeat protein
MAAEQGLARAQFNLGVMYANGQGVAQNDDEAGKWLRKAAEQGHEGAREIIAENKEFSKKKSPKKKTPGGKAPAGPRPNGRVGRVRILRMPRVRDDPRLRDGNRAECVLVLPQP